MQKIKQIKVLCLAMALALCFQTAVFAQNSKAEKTLKSFYFWYLKNEKKDQTKMKQFLTTELYQKIQQMEDREIDEYFTKKSKEMSLSEFLRFEQRPYFSHYLLHLWAKNGYYARLTVSLKKENGKWKIDYVGGQTAREIEEQFVEGKIETPELKNNLIKLEKPVHPPAAKAVRAYGEVKVEIEVDESGKVVSAKAISGHPLLRITSEQLALKSTFSPIIIDGKPVKTNGIIIYTFNPWWDYKD